MKKQRRRLAFLGIMTALALSFAGCGDEEESVSYERTNTIRSDSGSSETSRGNEQFEGSGAQDRMASDSQDKEASDSGEKKKLSFEEIEQLAEECSFHVHWYSQDGEFDSGTAFVMDSAKHGQKVLVTAFHFLWPDGADTFKGEELPDFVLGGTVSYAKSGEDTGASLKNCIVIRDADVVPQIDKDVAAFTLQGADNIKTLKLADSEAKEGDTIYLLANLWDTVDVHENCVYKGTVVEDKDGMLTYRIGVMHGTTGASGGPIVNEYGEVVAIHMASGTGSYVGNYFGHSAASFGAQIDNGTISNITYPEEPESLDPPVYVIDWVEPIKGFFYDFQIKDGEFTDSVGDVKAPEGQVYLVLDVSFDTRDIYDEDVYMFEDDLAVFWDLDSDEYGYRCDDFQGEGIFGSEFVVPGNKLTEGKMVYLVPDDIQDLYLELIDYYYDRDNVEHIDAYYYFVLLQDGE